jgi:hypothetical protein
MKPIRLPPSFGISDVKEEAEAPEAVVFWCKPENMPLPLPFCFKVVVRILVDFR